MALDDADRSEISRIVKDAIDNAPVKPAAPEAKPNEHKRQPEPDDIDDSDDDSDPDIERVLADDE